MKSEKLFEAVTEIDDKYIEEARSVKNRMKGFSLVKTLLPAAACIAFVFAAGIGIITLMGGGASAGGGYSGEPGTDYMYYTGPTFPLSAMGETEGLSFSRSTDFDFSPYSPYTYSYETAKGETVSYLTYDNDAIIRDNYTVTNSTNADITFTAVYPFAGSLSTNLSRIPQITVDGKALETDFIIGQNGDTFAENNGEEREDFDSWYGYKKLLESGKYFEAAFEENPVLDQKVTVYKFGIEYNAENEVIDALENPDMEVFFDSDHQNTSVMYYNFNGFTINSEEGKSRLTANIPQSYNLDFGTKNAYIVVLSGDIENLAIKSTVGILENWDDEKEETDAFTVTTEKYETTFGEVMLEMIKDVNSIRYDYGEEHHEPGSIVNEMTDEEYLGYVAKLMYDRGVLSVLAEDVGDRMLEDYIVSAAYVGRVIYVTFDVTVPAGESVTIGTTTIREASYDFVGEKNAHDINGFDMVTKVGTNLVFEEQTASVSNTEEIEIVYNNFGFDLENGITNVTLGDEEHYWMEITRKK